MNVQEAMLLASRVKLHIETKARNPMMEALVILHDEIEKEKQCYSKDYQAS